MPNLNYVRSEVERMRVQIARQRRDIRELQEAGISTDSATALLERMLTTIEGLRVERDRLWREEKLKGPIYTSGKRIHGTPARRRA
jgi:hypothetical protein